MFLFRDKPLKIIKLNILILFILIFSQNCLYSESDVDLIFQKIKYAAQLDDNINTSFKVMQSDKLNLSVYHKNQNTYEFFISRKLLDFFANNPDAIAFSIAHEFAHIKLKHFQNSTKAKNDLEQNYFQKEDEFQADEKGMQVALSAGYSFKKVLSGLKQFADAQLNPSELESISNEHPTWFERMQKLDKKKSNFWQAMQSFENGKMFLEIGQYKLASSCFSNVIREFPESYEAWANKGYADLLEYCDNLSANDIARFNIGYISTGNYFREIESNDWQMRGINSDLWLEAYSALKTSIEINDNQPITLSNFGLAYLVNPYNGPDYVNANKYFDKAVKIIESQDIASSPIFCDIYINASVSQTAAGATDKSLDYLSKSKEIFKNFTEDQSYHNKEEILFNEAFALMHSNLSDNKIKALKKFEEFIGSASKSSIWRKIATQHYLNLTKSSQMMPKTLSNLLNNDTHEFEKVVGLESNEFNIFLTQKSEDFEKELSKYARFRSNITTRYELYQYQFPELGLKLIASDKLLAMIIKSNKIGIQIRKKGLAAESYKIRKGHRISTLPKDLAKIIKQNHSTIQLYKNKYTYINELGIGLIITNGTIEEIAIVGF